MEKLARFSFSMTNMEEKSFYLLKLTVDKESGLGKIDLCYHLNFFIYLFIFYRTI